MYSKDTEICIITKYRGYIPALGQTGPIPNPIKIPAKIVADMVISGAEVYQVNPSNGMTKLLDVSNVYDDTKFDEVKPVVEAPVTTPSIGKPIENVISTGTKIVTPVTPIETKTVPVETAVVTANKAPVSTVSTSTPVSETATASTATVSDVKTTDATAATATSSKK